MSTDPRVALNQFVNALQRHFELAASGRDQDDQHVQEAFNALSDAFDAYDEALYEEFGLTTPFFLAADDDFDDDDDSDDEDDDDEDEDDGDDDVDLDEFDDDEEDDEPYRGLEVDEFDYESE